MEQKTIPSGWSACYICGNALPTDSAEFVHVKQTHYCMCRACYNDYRSATNMIAIMKDDGLI